VLAVAVAAVAVAVAVAVAAAVVLVVLSFRLMSFKKVLNLTHISLRFN
jgi:hypothetical protein